MAHKRARAARTAVCNQSAAVFSYYVRIKIHQPLPADARGSCAHAVGSVTYRATEAVLGYVQAVLPEAVISDDVGQIMTLRAHRIRTREGQVWIGEQVRDYPARHCGLAELIVALEDVRVDRSVGTVRAGAAELTIVVAIMTIGTEDARSHCSHRRRSILIQLVQQKAWLR